ncbi:MAG: hypothetical protein ACYC2T_00170 [Bacillota bacterium]
MYVSTERQRLTQPDEADHSPNSAVSSKYSKEVGDARGGAYWRYVSTRASLADAARRR